MPGIPPNGGGVVKSKGKTQDTALSHGHLPATLASVKRLLAILFALTLGSSAQAQQENVDGTDLLQTVREALEENEVLLDALGIDVPETQRFLTNLQTQFQGTDVYDLSESRDTARQLLPILQQFEETQDYATWLRRRLDYLDMAERLRKQASIGRTNTARLPEPSPQAQRKAWVTVVEQTPAPPAANEHVSRLKKIFAEEKVPVELVWVAEVESSVNPKAKSPAGAAGLFHLMPATARSLDLSVGWLRDDRLHPEKSGRAGAKYLRQLYNRFGDWQLALAAYNAGEGRVAELLKKSKIKTFDAIAHRLPAETQMYVPKVEATLRKREGVVLSALKLPKT
jgi:membrane-bound lytic murein transglycosylase D